MSMNNVYIDNLCVCISSNFPMLPTKLFDWMIVEWFGAWMGIGFRSPKMRSGQYFLFFFIFRFIFVIGDWL